jgi:hypothetical protein
VALACVNLADTISGTDLERATSLREKACALGSVSGCLKASVEYRYGRGAPQDITKAAALLQQGCERNNRISCERLGEAERALKSRALQNPCKSGHWRECALAADVLWGNQASPDVAQMALQACSKRPDTCDVLSSISNALSLGSGTAPQDKRGALDLLRLACEHQKGNICLTLARAYSVRNDYLEAVAWQKTNCSRGLVDGCADLAKAHAMGWGVEVDHARARELYRDACRKRHAESCAELGSYYRSGQHVPRDLGQAEGLFHKACDYTHESDFRRKHWCGDGWK